MKVCIIQPGYSTDYSKSDEYFENELKLLDECDETVDLIVLPESCDIPCLSSSKEESEASSNKYNSKLLEAVKNTRRTSQP